MTSDAQWSGHPTAGEALTPGTDAWHVLPREARLLLLLCRPKLAEAGVEACRDLLDSPLDWGRLVDLAGRNKVLPLVGYRLDRNRLFHGREGRPLLPYHYVFTSVFLSHRARNEALMLEFGTVLRRLEESEVRYAVRKGPVVLDSVYPDLGTRRMTDLDLLVHPQDRGKASEALHACGYEQGRVSEDGLSVEPFSRRTQIFWRMNLRNELPYVRLAAREDLTAYTIDICRDFLPANDTADAAAGAVGARVPELLERARTATFCGLRASRLSETDHLLDLCLHLFKEATTLYYIENEADVQLQKFVDVAGSLPDQQEEGRWDALVERGEEYACSQGLYFALYYTETIFPGTVPQQVLTRLRPTDLGYLEQFGAPDGTPRKWNRSLVHRMFALGERGELPVSGVPRQ